MASSMPRGLKWVGLDVAKDAIAVATLAPSETVASCHKVGSDEASIRRLVRQLGPPARLRVCYEAGRL